MQPKYRSNGDGFRLGSQFGRNRSRNARGGSFGRSYSRPYNPPSSKEEIFMEAGRLAAEYLVSRGVLPASALPGSSLPDVSLPESRGRESAPQVPYSEGRTSALARLGNSGSDAGYGRRRFNDDYDRTGSRKSVRGRRRMGYYNDRGYGLDWSRDRGRNGSWNERSRGGYSDSIEDDDDFAPGYSSRDRRGGCDEVGSSVSRVAGEERHSKSEAVGESGSELDDTGSKASSNSTRKEAPLELDVELSKGLDDVRVPTFESGEVRSGELEKTGDEDMDVKPGGIEEASGSNHGNNLLSLCGFTKVPTRPRSSLAHKGAPVGQGPEIEVSGKVEVPSRQDPEMVIDEVSADEPTEKSHIIHVESSITEAPSAFSTLVTECKGEGLQSQGEAHSSLQCLGSSTMSVDETQQNDSFIQNMSQKVESEMETKLPFISLSQHNESYDFDGHTIKKSGLQVIMPPQDEEIFDVVSELKSVASTAVPKDEAQSFVRLGEEKQNQPASFDLNLMDAPEILDIPEDPGQESCQTSAPLPEGQKQLPIDFDLSVGCKAGNTHNYNQISVDDKVIIDLEDEATVEANSSDSSKPRNEVIYPAVENVLEHTAHPDDLPVIQDSYGLAISDYLSCSPSVQADLNNLQVGMGLHGAEGFTGVEDSIYGSLGDIGFMEVWDQPTHDYEKFF